VILEGKRILVTGVVNRRSIAYSVAERAQAAGAEVLLSSFGRIRRMTERAAKNLPKSVDILELDVSKVEDFEALHDSIKERWGGLDGAVHAIAFAPEDALGGDFLATPVESAKTAFEISAYSYKALAAALAPLFPEPPAGGGEDPAVAGGGEDAEAADAAAEAAGTFAGGSLVGLDFDAQVAWPSYDWMGVSKAALEAVNRYLARDLGGRGVRANLVSAGPISTVAASGVPGFSKLTEMWSDAAPLAWNQADPAPVADTVLFLLSDLSRAISGEIIHVDGGYHAVAPAPPGV
jgi:enoyl ACP reductase